MVAIGATDLHAGDPATLENQPPVVGFFLVDAHIVGAVFVFADQVGILEVKVGIQHIGPAEEVPHLHGGGNVVAFLIVGILHKGDSGVFLFQNVKLLAQIAPYNVDFLDAGGQDGIQHRFDHGPAVDADQGFGGVEGNGHQPGAETRCHDDGPLNPIGLQGRKTFPGDVDVLALRNIQESLLQQLGQGFVDHAQGQAGAGSDLPLAQLFSVSPLHKGEYLKKFSVQ